MYAGVGVAVGSGVGVLVGRGVGVFVGGNCVGVGVHVGGMGVLVGVGSGVDLDPHPPKKTVINKMSKMLKNHAVRCSERFEVMRHQLSWNMALVVQPPEEALRHHFNP